MTMIPHSINRVSPLCAVLVGLALSACKGPPALMPTPVIYHGLGEELSRGTVEARRDTTVEVLYATDRKYYPSQSPDPYPAERERFLGLGVATVSFGDEETTWPGLVESTTEQRTTPIHMHLTSVDEFGPLDDSTIYFDPISQDPNIDEASRRYASLINERLAESKYKDINVYVAPFKVHFDMAVFTAAEFHHYIGRQGVFIAYSWPTQTGNLNYLNAAENAYRTRRLLRIFVEYLARETDAERINLMTYSAGARVLSGAMHQLLLKSSHMDDAEIDDKFPIGEVIFCAPDLDGGAFLEHVADGMDRMRGRVTVYTNVKDSALKMSRFLYKNDRLGTFDTDDMTPQGKELLFEGDELSFISVMNAEDALKGNGHGYFRMSPWVSTDILLMLGPGLGPAQRGLERAPGDPVWRFPDHYPDNVKEVVERLRRRRR